MEKSGIYPLLKTLMKSHHEVAMKTFVDFYAISKASRVIRILAPEMYNTVFSYYAAVLGGIIPEELHV